MRAMAASTEAASDLPATRAQSARWYVVPAGSVLRVSDVVLQNPNFDKGKADIPVAQPRIYYGELNTDYSIVGAGQGDRFDANKGTPMKEWFSLDPESELAWLPLAREALDFARPAR